MQFQAMMRRTDAGPEPADEDAAAILAKLRAGDRVLVKVWRPRSIRQHKLFWALLTHVAHATEFESAEHLLTACKVALGKFDLVKMPSGKVVVAPSSISFAAMASDEFQRFFDDCVRVICRDLLPGVASADLVDEVMQMIGGAAAPEPPACADDPLVADSMTPF